MLKGGKRSQRRGFLKEIPYFKITPDEIILDMMSTSAFFRACKVIQTHFVFSIEIDDMRICSNKY